jgi:hypothetical protein
MNRIKRFFSLVFVSFLVVLSLAGLPALGQKTTPVAAPLTTSVEEAAQYFVGNASGVEVITYDLRSSNKTKYKHWEVKTSLTGDEKINYSPYKNYGELFTLSEEGKVRSVHLSKVTTSRHGAFADPTSGILGKYETFQNGISGFAMFSLENSGIAGANEAGDGAVFHHPYTDNNNFRGNGSLACFRNVGLRGNLKDAWASWNSVKEKISYIQNQGGEVRFQFRYLVSTP